MNQEEKTLTQIFRDFAAADACGRDHTLLLNAVEDIEHERLTPLRVSPFTDKTSVRFVRFKILGILEDAPAIVGCFVSDIAMEEIESLSVMEEMLACLPAGRAPASEPIRGVLASDIKTIIAVVLYKNDRDEWVRYVYHHPGLSQDEALSTARSFIFNPKDAPN